MTSNLKKNSQEKQLIDGLRCLLADTYLLYVKTQNFHWHVTGPYFPSYHKMFEEQYQALTLAIDLLAERIRALHADAPASFAEFLQLSSLKEAKHQLTATQMVQNLLSDHEFIAKTLSPLFNVAEACGDEVTLDLLIERKTEHDKTAWMLRSALGKN